MCDNSHERQIVNLPRLANSRGLGCLGKIGLPRP